MPGHHLLMSLACGEARNVCPHLLMQQIQQITGVISHCSAFQLLTPVLTACRPVQCDLYGVLLCLGHGYAWASSR